MNSLKKTLLTLTSLILALAAGANDTAEQRFRAATQEDLLGFWKQVDIRGQEGYALSDLVYSGRQYWEFFPDNHMRVIVFEEGRAPSPEELLQIRENGPKRMTYTFQNEDGLLEIVYPQRSQYNVVATYYVQGLPLPASMQGKYEKLPQAGDVTLTYIDLKTGKPLFFRLLRRIGEVVEPVVVTAERASKAPRQKDSRRHEEIERNMQRDSGLYFPPEIE